jgi:hypothetical protein
MAVGGATVAASLCGPEGSGIYTLAMKLTSDPFRARVAEYQPITAGLLWGGGWMLWLPFEVMVVLGGIYFVALRGWRDLVHLSLFVFFLYEACRQVRLVEMFTIVAAIPVGTTIARALRGAAPMFERRPAATAWGLTLAVATMFPLVVVFNPGVVFGSGMREATYPEGAARFVEGAAIRGRMFNTYAFGGYLTWRLPDRPVFIDGRYRRLYTPELLGDYLAAGETASGWDAAKREYDFDYAIAGYDLQKPIFPTGLTDDPDWAIVYWDDISVVAVRRTPEREALIRSHEYRIAKPKCCFDFGYLDAYLATGDPAVIDDVLSRLEREFGENPKNQVPVLAKTYLLHGLGSPRLPEVRRELERIQDLRPDFATKHSAYALVLLEMGDVAGARRELERAARLDPNDPLAADVERKLSVTSPGSSRSPGAPVDRPIARARTAHAGSSLRLASSGGPSTASRCHP